MAKVIDFIQDNISTVKKLVNIGCVPLSFMTNFDIYNMYKAVKDEPATMKRYKRVALNCKVSVDTVRKAVREMERNL